MLRRVAKLKIEPGGALAIKPFLPAGEYVVSADRPSKSMPLKSRAQLATWIDRCVLGDLTTLSDGIRLAERSRLRRKRGGGNFLLAAGCCMALEYMAFVYTGDENATSSVLKFSKAFLAPVDPRYGDLADLMWRSFRNGLIHGSWPQLIESAADPGITIRVGVGNEMADEHLSQIASVSGPAFGVSAPRLLRDLKRAFRPAFRHWIVHEAPDAVLRRGGPKCIELSEADRLGNRQFQLVKGWRRDA
jgi:hypothetical protein